MGAVKDDDIGCKLHLDARYDSPKKHHQTGGKRLEVIMSVVLGIGLESLTSKDLNGWYINGHFCIVLKCLGTNFAWLRMT